MKSLKESIVRSISKWVRAINGERSIDLTPFPFACKNQLIKFTHTSVHHLEMQTPSYSWQMWPTEKIQIVTVHSTS